VCGGNAGRSQIAAAFFNRLADPEQVTDALSTMVLDGTCVKVLAWYDNEMGYVHRMMELAQRVGQHLR
jgi:glyceraldehyde-3-phosphate dehydrogenase/erythrose-4-phosphate dehydrogenase